LDQKWEWKQQVFQEHLNQWKKKKLIIRKPHPNDGRSVLIHLTDMGKTHRALSKIAVIKFNEKIIGEIGKESLNNFHFVIEKINELIGNKNIFKF
jgi:DNA-binding MarR family transcriptional regulator